MPFAAIFPEIYHTTKTKQKKGITMTELNRYSIITEKNPREIVLLRGSGCKWRRCRFCDYHMDYSRDTEDNFKLNQNVLEQITGVYQKLEVINSGSFVDLDKPTMDLILNTCILRHITQLHFECHWMHRDHIAPLKQQFQAHGIHVKIKIGVETFDPIFRESYLDKGITCDSPEEIADYFDEACLLFGIPGQSEASMIRDIETGLTHFDRICINIMIANTRPIKPDPSVIRLFSERIYPKYRTNPRVDILMENTDFGVGDK